MNTQELLSEELQELMSNAEFFILEDCQGQPSVRLVFPCRDEVMSASRVRRELGLGELCSHALEHFLDDEMYHVTLSTDLVASDTLEHVEEL